VSFAGVGLTVVGAFDGYDDADGDTLLRSRSKRVDRFSEIPHYLMPRHWQKNAPADQCGLNPQQEGNVTADLPVQWTLLDARRKG
jgi:hypothetical protein